MAQTTSLVFNGGAVPSPAPTPSGSGKAKLLKTAEITITEQGVQVTKKVICDPDSVTSVAPFMEVLTSAKLAELVNANSVLVLADGDMQYLMANASVTVEDNTPVCTAVNFLGLSKENRAKVAYDCTRITDELTLQQVIEVGEPVETNFNLVIADDEDTDPKTLADKLTLVDVYHDPEDPGSPPMMLQIVTIEDEQGNRKVAIDESELSNTFASFASEIGFIEDQLGELPSDEHGYFNSSLYTTPGDGTTTNLVMGEFRISNGRDVHGESIEFVPTRQEGGIDYGEVYLNPGTYILNIQYTLQWVGNPRGTFLPLVANVADQPFDFSYEHEDVIRTTRIVTKTTRGKLVTNIAIDADTPSMGVWVKSLEVAQIASYNHPAVAHDTTLTGTGKLDSPLEVTPAAFGKVKDIPTSISQFRTGDVIPVDGPNGPAKMSKDDLMLETAKNISFELGDITYMSATGWNYASSSTRVRTAQNQFVPLDVGDKICLKNAGRVRMYILAHNLDGTTTSSGWLTEDFTATKKCNAAIVIAGGADSNLSSVPDGVSIYEYYSSCISVVIGGKCFAFSQNVLSRLNMVERDVSKRIVLTTDFFELGNISISNNGWSYSDSPDRIRLKQGLTLVLDKGDSIVFGTTVSRYVGIRNIETGEYSSVGWIFSNGITEFVARFKCEVVVLFSTNDFAEVSNFCVNPYTYSTLVKKYADFVMNGVYPLVNVSSDFYENGTINLDGTSPAYNSYLSDSRIRTKYGMVFEFKKGEIIHFDNVSHAKGIGVINESGVLTKVVLNASTSDYVFPYDAYAVFFVIFDSAVTPKDLNGVYVSPGVMQRGYVKWIDLCNELIYLSRPNIVNSLFPSGVVGVAHRGYSITSPENTMPAFKKAVEEGFCSIETDVRLTSDGVFVLLHDDTIDRTSNGTGYIDQMTYSEAMQYDFGSWRSSEFAGTHICRLDDFLDFCAMTKVFPFLEIKFAQTGANTNAFVSLLKDKCFWGKCVIFGGSTAYRDAIISKEHPEYVVQPIGFFVSQFTIDGEYTSSDTVNNMIDLAKKGYAVMALFGASVITETMSNFLTRKNIFVDVYVVDSTSDIEALPKSTKFVTSDVYEASKIWKDAAMS